ncbi:DUF1343 domain-containing protein [Opitutales bacterium]|nr:DUF1343 domain-containing protein [Opitutales bacterium]
MLAKPDAYYWATLINCKVLNSITFGAFLLIPCLSVLANIEIGIDHLESTKFEVLHEKKVGLLTHPAGKNANGISTVMILKKASQVNLVSLFGPEHGIYGDEKASVPVDDKIDHRTGLPVYSLYGKFRKPTKEMLANLDCLVIDLQDVGVRCYTYISCMKYAMEACFENGVEVIVLDRPNPLGGNKVAGPMIDLEWISYVGAFPMPFVHGLTIAEIALWSKQVRGILNIDDKIRKKGKLTLVPMKGWNRAMTWPSSGLKWHPTSPNIPHLDSVAGYPMTGLGAQLGNFKHGIGTKHPFRFLTFKGKTAEELKMALQSLKLPGLDYRIMTLDNPSGRKEEGIYLIISDWQNWQPTALAFAMMQLTARWQDPNPFLAAKESEATLFNKHVGSSDWWNYLVSAGRTVDPSPFLEKWKIQVSEFRKQTKPFLLY